MRAMLSTLLTVIGIGTAAFLALCLFLYLRQESFLFFPGPNDAALLEQWETRRVEIPAPNAVLEGWWADNADASTSAVILYFGGNAEDVLYAAATARSLNARRLLVVNYRGYGATKGTPGQAALFEDALAIYDYAAGAGGAGPRDIVVMGRSLGSGVATLLASQRPVRAAILVTPYDSILAVAERHYSLFPVRMLLKHPFPSSDLAQQAKVPALIIAAERDNIIPPVHAQRLFDSWAGEKRIHILAGADHNDIEQHPGYYPLINAFLLHWLPR